MKERQSAVHVTRPLLKVFTLLPMKSEAQSGFANIAIYGY